MKTLTIMLLTILTGSLTAQKNEWFLGFAVNPQHSMILNSNDRMAAKIEPGTTFPKEGSTNRIGSHNTQMDNEEIIIPNSFRAELVAGYKFSKHLSLQSGLVYSFQQQKYFTPHSRGWQRTTIEMKNTFHYLKLPFLSVFSVELTDVLHFEAGAGVQASLLLEYLEDRLWKANDGSGDERYFFVSGTTTHSPNGATKILTGPLFHTFNLEARALIGLSWSYDDRKEFFFHFTADHSLFDIENKSARRNIDGSIPYYEHWHSPYKWSGDPRTCPDCSSTRPPSYNFTAGISFGMRFNL